MPCDSPFWPCINVCFKIMLLILLAYSYSSIIGLANNGRVLRHLHVYVPTISYWSWRRLYAVSFCLFNGLYNWWRIAGRANVGYKNVAKIIWPCLSWGIHFICRTYLFMQVNILKLWVLLDKHLELFNLFLPMLWWMRKIAKVWTSFRS